MRVAALMVATLPVRPRRILGLGLSFMVGCDDVIVSIARVCQFSIHCAVLRRDSRLSNESQERNGRPLRVTDAVFE